jgi:hypothetical protein
MHVERLSPALEPAYDDLLLRHPTSMLFQSLRYRAFLKRILEPEGLSTPTVEDHDLVAVEGGRVVGGLPAFVKHNATYGPVLNSLPFVGSNGGALVAGAADGAATARALVQAFNDLADSLDAVSSTLINRPLEPDDALYEAHSGFTALDERIGQVTALPTAAEGADDATIDAAIMAILHQKTRNVVRKAASSHLTVRSASDVESLRALFEIHRENLEAIGAAHKPWSVFEAVRSEFRYDDDYRVYIAEKDGVIVAGLLVFYFNRVAEYFTPATVAEYRTLQPQSLLCLHAMREAMKRGCTHWNWGGTGKSQTGVYLFKSRWGTTDHPYRYFVRERRPTLRGLSGATLLAEYPYFFTVPFSVLTPDTTRGAGA